VFLEIRGCLSRIPFEVVTQASILSASDAVWLIGITLVLTRAARRVIHRRAGTRRPARAGQGRRVQHKLDGLSTEPRHSNDSIARWCDWSFGFPPRLSPIVSNLNVVAPTILTSEPRRSSVPASIGGLGSPSTLRRREPSLRIRSRPLDAPVPAERPHDHDALGRADRRTVRAFEHRPADANNRDGRDG